MEATYVSETNTLKELLWLQMIVRELNSLFETLTTLHRDNQCAIALMKDNKFYMCMKHIAIWYHFIHEAIEDSSINMQYIPTNNIFTKPLTKAKFEQFMDVLAWVCLRGSVQFTSTVFKVVFLFIFCSTLLHGSIHLLFIYPVHIAHPVFLHKAEM
jgi:hypothetical protein